MVINLDGVKEKLEEKKHWRCLKELAEGVADDEEKQKAIMEEFKDVLYKEKEEKNTEKAKGGRVKVCLYPEQVIKAFQEQHVQIRRIMMSLSPWFSWPACRTRAKASGC